MDREVSGYIKNCFLIPTESQEGPMFEVALDRVIPYLDGYAIIPLEEYEILKGRKNNG